MLLSRNKPFLFALLCLFFIWDTTDGRPMEYIAPSDHSADTSNDILLIAMKNREQIFEQIAIATLHAACFDHGEFALPEEPTRAAQPDALTVVTADDHLHVHMSLQL